jgi:uncharacterized membrane protein
MKGIYVMSQPKKKQKKSNIVNIILVTLPVLLVMIISIIIIKNAGSDTTVSSETTNNSDLVINISDITEKAKFYPAEIDGTKLEVLAVKAPDGSIRTAFNTCQVCYSSGRGYYIQDGDVLVCQNCGNRFKMNQVEMIKGGCNPVPITSSEKTVDDTSITISGEYLKQAKSIFANWKI